MGLQKVEYIGLYDKTSYVGAVTGIRYDFGLLTRQYGYIDARDIPGLLASREDTLPAFRTVQYGQ